MNIEERWKRLSKEKRNIKIAELCGWKVLRWRRENISRLYPPNNKTDLANLHTTTYDDYESLWKFAPDYLHDLNAMNEAEKLLNDEQHMIFDEMVWSSLEKEEGWVRGCIAYRRTLSATAAQRAQAFFITMYPRESK